MTKKVYVLYPGLVKSSWDGEEHYVDAHTLARLYRVSISDCVVFDAKRPENFFRDNRDCEHLYPKSNGYYHKHDRQE